MAKAPAGQSSSTTLMLAIAAVVVVAVFLGWLALTSEPSAIATVQEDTTVDAVPDTVADTMATTGSS
jgi:hypothetical protein